MTASATLLLPVRARLPARTLPDDIGKALGRADSQRLEAGEVAQLRRHFQLVPDHWPVAALTRQHDAGDAGQAGWLRADPCRISPDMTGARMMAYGEALELDHDDIAQLLQALRPLFGDAGFQLDAPLPSRWYLRLPTGTRLPAFAPVQDVLGDDLFAHLPAGEAASRWRALLSEAQVLLHNHPWNAHRVRNGRQPVNSLWFWGGGTAPDFVRTPYRQIKGQDVLLRSLADAAGVGSDGNGADGIRTLVDLRHLRQFDLVCNDALRPLLAALHGGELDELTLDFQDGQVFRLERRQRWRWFRKPWRQLDDSQPGHVSA